MQPIVTARSNSIHADITIQSTFVIFNLTVKLDFQDNI